jgi:hypothetical protein
MDFFGFLICGGAFLTIFVFVRKKFDKFTLLRIAPKARYVSDQGNWSFFTNICFEYLFTFRVPCARLAEGEARRAANNRPVKPHLTHLHQQQKDKSELSIAVKSRGFVKHIEKLKTEMKYEKMLQGTKCLSSLRRNTLIYYVDRHRMNGTIECNSPIMEFLSNNLGNCSQLKTSFLLKSGISNQRPIYLHFVPLVFLVKDNSKSTYFLCLQ